MSKPRLGFAEQRKLDEGFVEVYLRQYNNGLVIRAKEFEKLTNARENRLKNIEIESILGNAVVIDGEDIYFMIYYTLEGAKLSWDEVIAEAEYEVTHGGD